MAIALRGTTTPSTTGGTVDPIAAISLPGSTAAGDLVGIFASWKYDTQTVVSVPTGWQSPANNETTGGAGSSGVDTGLIRLIAFFLEYDGAWAMPSIDLSAAPNVSMFGAMSWSKAANEVWGPVICANSSDTSGSSTSYDPAASGTVIDFGSGDWLGCFSSVNGDDGTPGAITLTATGVTFGAKVDRFGATGTATTIGDDMRVFAYDVPYSSGTASGGPDTSIAYTSGNANLAGASVFFRLRVFDAGAANLPHLVVPRGQEEPSWRNR